MSVFSAPAALVLLAGCGLTGGGEDSPPSAESPSSDQQSPEATGSSPSEPPSSDAADPDASPSASDASPSDGDSTPSSEAASPSQSPPEPSTAPAAEPTDIVSVWVDHTWTVEWAEEDFCAMGGASPSQFALDGYLFTCGPTAASALACDVASDDGTVECITNAAEKRALRFPSPTITATGAPEPGPALPTVPLHVTLADGNRCYVLSHDHGQHWNGMFSWYGCDDGSELLTDEDLAGTFERSETWTVQRSVDKGEPVERPLKEVVFAGLE